MVSPVLVTVLLVVSILLLITSTLLSAIASTNAKSNSTNAQRYAMYSAIISGLGFLVLFVALIAYHHYTSSEKAPVAAA